MRCVNNLHKIAIYLATCLVMEITLAYSHVPVRVWGGSASCNSVNSAQQKCQLTALIRIANLRLQATLVEFATNCRKKNCVSVCAHVFHLLVEIIRHIRHSNR